MKILCIGRNYAKHAAELNNPIPDDPIIFTKPSTSLLEAGEAFEYPDFSEDVHFECELVLRIGKKGKRIHEEEAASYVEAMALGIDFTARDVQTVAKQKGLPWALAKGFDGGAPVSSFIPASDLPPLSDIRYTCSLNGELRQEGHTAMMLFPCTMLIAYLSRFITLEPGDLIFTGTPAGVGPVKRGDLLEGSLEGRPLLRVEVR
jgi:2-keto-4-pentenoate hydratase/2-oxohepta-3-ene-1,7-dioic acid hydratase in catechol pathway